MNQIKCDYCGLELHKNSFLMLPCGFLVCSEHISDIVQSKWCIVCQNHELDFDKFMSMAMNKMVLNESKLKQKTLELNSSFSFLRSIRTDPQSYMSGHFQNLKNQLDMRRSELKQEITRQIDDHYDHLIGILQEHQEKYLKKIESKLKNAELEDIHTEHEYRQEFNIKDRLDFIENKLIDLQNKIKNNDLLKFDLDQYKLFGFSKGKFDIRKIFGQFSTEKLVNVKKYECVNSVHVHSNQVFCIDELESGEIVTSSKDKTIKIWDIYTGNCLNTLFGHTNWVLQFIILNRNEIISCSGDGSIRKWNLKSGDCLRAIQASNKEVWSLLMMENEVILSGCSEGLVKKWNFKTGECKKVYKEHLGIVYSLIKVNSDSFLSSSADNTIIYWNYNSAEKLLTFEDHSSYVWKMLVLNENEFISGAADGSIKLWNLDESKCVNTFKEHEKCVRNFVKINDNQILTSFDDGLVKLLDLKEKKFNPILNTNCTGLHCIKLLNNGLIISTSNEGLIKVWRPDFNKKIQE